MSKFFQIIVVLLLANSSVLGQDTIERVYAPKHLYLPLSFGFSKQLSLGTLYAGEIRKYLDQNPASDCFKTARFTANYTLFRRGKHALDFGLNLETYNIRIMDMIQHAKFEVAIGGKQGNTNVVPLENRLDLQISGIRVSPYVEYNYAFKESKRIKHSAGGQLNYGFFDESAVNLTLPTGEDLNTGYPRFLTESIPGLTQGFNFVNSLGAQSNLVLPIIGSYSGAGLQLHYDFMYVHTNFNDLRVRAYYSMWLPKSVNTLRFVNGIGVGLFLHIGRHFPKIDKF